MAIGGLKTNLLFIINYDRLVLSWSCTCAVWNNYHLSIVVQITTFNFDLCFHLGAREELNRVFFVNKDFAKCTLHCVRRHRHSFFLIYRHGLGWVFKIGALMPITFLIVPSQRDTNYAFLCWVLFEIWPQCIFGRKRERKSNRNFAAGKI